MSHASQFKLFGFVLVIIISCKSGDRLEITDLRFPDPDQIYIRSNNVDTMYVFCQRTDGTEERYYKAYDSYGRVTSDSTWGDSYRNHYDSRGLLVKRDYGRWMDSITYEFNLDSMLLKQKWNVSGQDVLFHFDTSGRIYRKIEFDGGPMVDLRGRRTDYEYVSDLLTCSVHYGSNGELNYEVTFHYSPERKIDSAILQTSYGHRQGWIYDSNGLLMMETWNHKQRDVRFAYVRRI